MAVKSNENGDIKGNKKGGAGNAVKERRIAKSRSSKEVFYLLIGIFLFTIIYLHMIIATFTLQTGRTLANKLPIFQG